MIIRIEVSSKTPIYQQIVDQLIQSISKGDIKVGESLPSVRNLAESCGINPMTVQKAYNQLKEKGYVFTNERRNVVISVPKECSIQVKKQLLDQFKLCIAEMRIVGFSKSTLENQLKEEWGD